MRWSGSKRGSHLRSSIFPQFFGNTKKSPFRKTKSSTKVQMVSNHESKSSSGSDMETCEALFWSISWDGVEVCLSKSSSVPSISKSSEVFLVDNTFSLKLTSSKESSSISSSSSAASAAISFDWFELELATDSGFKTGVVDGVTLRWS